MKTLSLILSLLLITTNVYAEWTFIEETVNGDVLFYEKSTVKRNGDKVRVWMYVTVSPNNKEAESLNMGSSRALFEIDCVNEINKTLSLQSFTKPGLKGDMTNHDVKNSTIDYIVLNSSHATLMKLVCKK